MGDIADVRQVQGARMSPANQWADLEGATGCFTGAVVGCRTACSMTPGRHFHILRQLAACNELLFLAKMQLLEILGALGKLALVNLHNAGFYVGEPQDFLVQKSAAVMYHVLKHHQCVASLQCVVAVPHMHATTSRCTSILASDDTEDVL